MNVPFPDSCILFDKVSCQPLEITQRHRQPLLRSIGALLCDLLQVIRRKVALFLVQRTDFDTTNLVAVTDEDAVILAIGPPFGWQDQRPPFSFQYIHQTLPTTAATSGWHPPDHCQLNNNLASNRRGQSYATRKGQWRGS